MTALKTAYDTIMKYNLLCKGDRIIAGVSGGADSVALLELLLDFRSQLELEIFVVHINHGIRGSDALSDQRFVEELCSAKGVECNVYSYDVPSIACAEHLTLEEAGRKVRYEAFEDAAKKHGANKIATAHHQNDNCETLLFNILRGSGLSGLCGIRPVRGKYIRPLICTSRREIEEYLNENGVYWVTDKTNGDAAYTRNRLRLELLPYIKEHFNPSVESALQRLSELCREDNDYIELQTDTVLNSILLKQANDFVLISRDGFNALHTAIKRRVVRRILERLSIPLKDVHMVHIDDCICMAVRSQSGARLCVGKCNVTLEQQGISFSRGEDVPEDYEYTLDVNCSVYIPQAGARVTAVTADEMGASCKNRIYISADDIKFPITVRNRRAGDTVRPLGMNGTKKLKDYFIDNKISQSERNKIPILVNNNRVIWVCGHVMSRDFKVTPHTKNILMLEINAEE